MAFHNEYYKTILFALMQLQLLLKSICHWYLFFLVGLPDVAVKESQQKIESPEWVQESTVLI